MSFSKKWLMSRPCFLILRRCAAHGALRVSLVIDTAPLHAQSIEQEQAADGRRAGAAQQLEGFSGLHAADDAGERGKDTHDGATCFFDILTFREEAVVARCVFTARIKDRELAAEADGSTRYQWCSGAHTGAVDGIARAEIVAAVENDVACSDQRFETLIGKAFAKCGYGDFRIDLGEGAAS